jgi:outer membrane biosynthesis protein TonB
MYLKTNEFYVGIFFRINMNNASNRPRAVPSLISNEPAPATEGAAVNILQGLSGREETRRPRPARGPLALLAVVLMVAVAAGIGWQGLTDTAMTADTAGTVQASVDAPVGAVEPPDAAPVTQAEAEAPVVQAPMEAATLVEAPMGLQAALEAAPVEAGADASETVESPAVALGLVSPQAAEVPEAKPVRPTPRAAAARERPRKAATPARAAATRPAQASASADKDVDIITAIVRNTGVR